MIFYLVSISILYLPLVITNEGFNGSNNRPFKSVKLFFLLLSFQLKFNFFGFFLCILLKKLVKVNYTLWKSSSSPSKNGLILL